MNNNRLAILLPPFFRSLIFLLLFLTAGGLYAQVKLWGVTSAGGDFNAGTIINLNTDGSDFNSISFDTIGGENPLGDLLEASNGKFYGMTSGLAGNDDGLIFEYDLVTDAYLVLHHFSLEADGAKPFGSLIESDGKFYGMTSEGGSNGFGTVFEFDRAGNVLTVLRHLDYSTDGAHPFGSLIESGGKFYGMTSEGGSNGDGTVFELNPAGNVFTVLKHFEDSADGAFPQGNLLESGGKLYGMTHWGGSFGFYGTLFELNPVGNVFTVLKHFDYSTDGALPFGSLIESSGKLYGMASQGGSEDAGTLFEFNPAGNVFTVLLNFQDYGGGGFPRGNLIESGGKFYGMTPFSANNDNGTIFEFNPAGNVHTVLLRFEDLPHGGSPSGSLIASGGKFYGMIGEGGSNYSGALFEFNPAGNLYTELKHFGGSPSGRRPSGGLLASGGKFYGMTSLGGNDDSGTLFELDPAGNMLTVLKHFDASADGASPFGNLIESGGKYYGMTAEGGSGANGTVFEFNPAGNVFTVLKHFNYFTDGGVPAGSLLESGGKFYGTTSQGGSNVVGTLFEFNPVGNVFTVLKHFSGTDGANPVGSLLASGGKFYGTTGWGGSNDAGTLFEFNPVGNVLTVLKHFDASTDGAHPFGSLLVSGGKFYGTASEGGNNNSGTLFEFDPVGNVFTVLKHFDASTDGASPYGSLLESGGRFYGMTSEGGSNGYGTVFEFDPIGNVLTVLRHFSGTDGANPFFGSLIAVGTPLDPDISITGKIEYHNGTPTGTGVSNAIVTLTGDESGSLTTTADGTYSFTITSGSNFTVTPTKSINKLNGVTTADATRVQQHVANSNPITDPYKIVAADVNKSNSVTTQDASIINQALLGNPAALAQFKTSWRFVPASHTMNNPPWGFPEKITLNDLQGNVPEQNFFGIKTGDVITPFTNPENFNHPEAAGFVLNAPDQALQSGEQVSVTFSANQFADLAALQFALKFDVEKLALVKIEPLGGLPVSMENFGTYNISEGEINVVWSQAEGVFVEEAAPVFQLTFNVLETGGTLSEALQLGEEVLEGHAYTSTLTDNAVQLQFFGTTSSGTPISEPKIELLQNRPNPFVDQTTIGFVLPEACEAQLRVFDAAGRVLFSQKKNYAAGRHEETLELEGASGILWCELLTPFGVLSKKMTAAK